MLKISLSILAGVALSGSIGAIALALRDLWKGRAQVYRKKHLESTESETEASENPRVISYHESLPTAISWLLTMWRWFRPHKSVMSEYHARAPGKLEVLREEEDWLATKRFSHVLKEIDRDDLDLDRLTRLREEVEEWQRLKETVARIYQERGEDVEQLQDVEQLRKLVEIELQEREE